jgi:hypothetical protein
MSQTLTLVLSDIVDSTRLNDELGDAERGLDGVPGLRLLILRSSDMLPSSFRCVQVTLPMCSARSSIASAASRTSSLVLMQTFARRASGPC